jgi:hypothetical protein
VRNAPTDILEVESMALIDGHLSISFGIDSIQDGDATSWPIVPNRDITNEFLAPGTPLLPHHYQLAMGQRHQIYLIARVNLKQGETTAAYRCVAAVHHQWCYRSNPLEGVRKLEKLLKHQEATSLLREELRRYPEVIETNPDHPCPYAEWVLQNAFSRANIDVTESNFLDFSRILKATNKVVTICTSRLARAQTLIRDNSSSRYRERRRNHGR